MTNTRAYAERRTRWTNVRATPQRTAEEAAGFVTSNRVVSQALREPRSPDAIVQAAGGAAAIGLAPLHRSGGQRLDPGVRDDMEHAFVDTFDDVRIHEDGQADRAGARAMTSGSDVYFARGAYAPSTNAGRRLLAHELTHVQQQRAGVVETAHTGGDALVKDRRLERAADEAGSRVAGGAAPRHRVRREAPASRRGIVQGAGGAVFLGLSAAAWQTAAAVASVVGTAAGVAGQVAAAIAAGDSGVQSMTFPERRMSATDEAKLRLIAQYRIVNEYVRRFLQDPANAAIRDEILGPPAPLIGPPPPPAPLLEPPPSLIVDETATPAAGAGSAAPPSLSVAPSAPAINEAILNAVKVDIQIGLQRALETSASTEIFEHIWTEDDATDEYDVIGVSGKVVLARMQGAALRETLKLSWLASKVPGLTLPREGEELVVHRFITGRLEGDTNWSTWDDLAVNIVGNGVSESTAANGAPEMNVKTKWYWSRFSWPDSWSFLEVTFFVNDDGRVEESKVDYIGEP